MSDGQVRFASRTDWAGGETEWSRALEARRRADLPFLDLTASNPTHCGFRYDARLLGALAAPGAIEYDPDPRGMLPAREAVAGYYADHGAAVDPSHLVLTTSTSEGYSWLFRLLCEPGDAVLIAQPSYPLFDLLAAIDDVQLLPYPLLYDHGWSLDLYALEQRITARTRAVMVVHPNNPTGHFTTPSERDALMAICRERGLALIVDEVFLDYPWPGQQSAAQSFAAGEQRVLTFVLSGLSKVAALPQMKLSWIACLGPEPLREEAMRRLEIIADTFLSMNAPVQHAAAGWLTGRHSIQQQLRERVRENLAALDRVLAGQHSLARLRAEGGWYATLRTPPFVSDEALAVRLIERAGVLVHPGGFFGFPERHRLVVSLLPEGESFRKGVEAMVAQGSVR